MAASKSAIRLVELGPRLTLQLMKVENGLLNGEVLYHEYIHKTEEELHDIKKLREEKIKLKANRTRVQEENKRKKERKKEEQKQSSLKGMHKKTENETLMNQAAKESNEARPSQEEDINDAEWYRQEVGEEPEKDLFDATSHLGSKNKVYGARKRKMQKAEKSADKSRSGFHKKDKGDQKFSKKGSNSNDSFDRKKKSPRGKVLGGKVTKKRKH